MLLDVSDAEGVSDEATTLFLIDSLMYFLERIVLMDPKTYRFWLLLCIRDNFCHSLCEGRRN